MFGCCFVVVVVDCLFVVQATSSTYSASDMCDTPATDYGWIDPGMMHRVVLDG